MKEQKITESVHTYRLPRGNGLNYDDAMGAQEAVEFGGRVVEDCVRWQARPEAILACYWLSAIASEPVREFFCCPLIVTFCQLGCFKARAFGCQSVRERMAEEARVGASADVIIATNRDEVDALTTTYQIPRHKIRLIPRGIDETVFHA